MEANEFRLLLTKAVAGDMESVEKILLLYMPMVNKHCRINGYIDEDLRQEMLIHIVKNLKKFKI